ncbi:hypothetical protein [Bacillus wiedmannii]|uniref:hypothetical protein n=1 Tax=Bacillus wiedmannii TaxID=1890302 RepID=UPI000B44F6CE|nr:hypothetical protein BK740_19725 [Bacillus thuringiensis serovar argentinensis]
MNTKLIIVEGLPGFGKSTTASLLYDILIEKNIDVELFLEGNPDHPADYDGVSCFDKSEFESLLVNSGDFREVISDRVTKRGNNYLLPYKKIENEYSSNFPERLLNNIFKNDIYELPLERNIELITEKWRDFVEIANNENKIYIFECCFIQNPLTIGMVKYGEEKEKVISYINALAKIIEKLNPVLFYIEQDDLEFSFRKVFNERANEWSAGFIEYYTNQGYGKLKGYHGLDGTIKVLEARRDIEREIFDMLNIKKIKIDNSQYEAIKYKSVIIEKLKSLEFLD